MSARHGSPVARSCTPPHRSTTVSPSRTMQHVSPSSPRCVKFSTNASRTRSKPSATGALDQQLLRLGHRVTPEQTPRGAQRHPAAANADQPGPTCPRLLIVVVTSSVTSRVAVPGLAARGVSNRNESGHVEPQPGAFRLGRIDKCVRLIQQDPGHSRVRPGHRRGPPPRVPDGPKVQGSVARALLFAHKSATNCAESDSPGNEVS